jgi:dihydroxyacid dehydratase/phosphogluconate dehydratase
MEEIYQITSALKFIPWGKTVPVLTDGRFSGVSTGACVGHIGPEALAGGPISRVQDGDLIEIMIDRQKLEGQINLVGTTAGPLAPEVARQLLAVREPHQDLKPHPNLPDDTRLWAALQAVSGGTWAGCIYDVDRILAACRKEVRPADTQDVLSHD